MSANHLNISRLRKQVVEPVCGQIKGARGFRQFLRRGMKFAKTRLARHPAIAWPNGRNRRCGGSLSDHLQAEKAMNRA
jgi:hypothetical protein